MHLFVTILHCFPPVAFSLGLFYLFNVGIMHTAGLEKTELDNRDFKTVKQRQSSILILRFF